jgi:hypothetical protein
MTTKYQEKTETKPESGKTGAEPPTDLATDDDRVKRIQDYGKEAADAAEGAKTEAGQTKKAREDVKKASSKKQVDDAVKEAEDHSTNAKTYAKKAKDAAKHAAEEFTKIRELEKKKIAESVLKKAREDEKNAGEDEKLAENFKDDAARIANTAGAARTTGR